MNTIQPVRYERHKRYVSVPILYFACYSCAKGWNIPQLPHLPQA